jgi:putative transposase
MGCFTFMVLISALFLLIRSLIVPRIALAAENLALRQQLAVLSRKIHRPQLHRRDRFFWVVTSRLWKDWRNVLIIVKPETVIRWHRQGFKLYWRWKSKAPVGRPKIDKEIRELIKRMSLENPLWGTPRIQSELRLLGFDLAESTVAKYRVRGSTSPSQTWKKFLANHAKQIAAIDFFTVPTLTFRNLYCFIILLHDRRQVIHFNVTTHPTAEWTARQLIEAFPEDSAPRYLLRDRDQIYGEEFRLRVKGMQIEEVITAPRSPFQNPYAERVIGSIRRECLDHLIIMGEDQLRRILRDYLDYYYSSSQYSFVLCP